MAISMISNEGEVVSLRNCSLRGTEVEEWMKALEESMKHSLKICVRSAMISYDNEERKDWIVKNCC